MNDISTKNYKYLNKINSPCDLKALSKNDIEPLADEIRRELVDIVTKNGGHLASNLGVVEMTLAIHRLFDSPHDHIIFDVGHQSYVHKMLTGRLPYMDTLRQAGGISGFTNRSESEYDCFGAGHSSTSLSASLGFAISDKLSGSDAYTVCVIGDGAYTGGMIHEALNNCRKDIRLIIIMNENEMSISKNIGRFAKHLSKIRSRSGYFSVKKATGIFLKKIPFVGKGLFRFALNVKKTLKNVLYGSNYFESMGLTYLGPVDGNDYFAVENILKEAKKLNESVVVHMKTQKGRGYAPAESAPDKYHGMSPQGAKKTEKKNFSSIMGEELTKMAEQDESICAVTAAMGVGTGLECFSKSYPERFFDVGIAEEHATTFAAGLAANGMKPFVAIYSTFLQRGYDSIIHDIALQNLPCVLCVDRAGLNAGDGATHHGIFDVAFLSQIPNLRIYTPITFGALKMAMQEVQ
jgi:1-deoxy-D-xylulose-5-phosphate synthase